VRLDGKEARPGGRPRRRLRTVVRVVACVVAFTIVAVGGYAWISYRHFTSSLTTVDGVPGKSGHDVDGSDQNILLVGDDHRPANASPQLLAQLSTQQDGGGTNTDTVMLLHLPAHGGAPTVISFPRDSWVDIPGYGKGKLNSAFGVGARNGGGDAGGMRELIQVIQNMTGLTVDHFVRVSMVGFYDIANVLGPLQVCLNQAAHDPYSGTDLPAGESTLDARQALSFVRQRHGLPRGDLDREVRQQYFLSAELHKVLSAGTLLNPIKQQHLLSAVSSALETDKGLDLLGLAANVQGLSADKVHFTTIPVAGTPTITDARGNRVDVVAIDSAAVPSFIAQVLGRPDPYTQATAAAPDTVTVHVINGTGRPGLAASNSAALARLGFHVDAPANGASQAATTITYPAGMESQAKTVAAHVPGATVTASTTVKRVTLTLGSAGGQVGSSSAAATPSTAAPSTTAARQPTGSGSPTKAFTSSSCIN
jgi:LCP family protein required for cell wall assembly